MVYKILDTINLDLGNFCLLLKILPYETVYSSILINDCLSPGDFLQNVGKRESRTPHIFMFRRFTTRPVSSPFDYHNRLTLCQTGTELFYGTYLLMEGLGVLVFYLFH